MGAKNVAKRFVNASGLFDPFQSLPDSTPTDLVGATPTSSSTVSSSSSTSSKSTSSVSSTTTTTSTISSTLSTTSTSSSVFSTITPAPAFNPVTSTTIVVETSSFIPPAVNASSSNATFIQNPVASGFIFTIIGLVGLVFVIFVTTFFIRRKRNKKLVADALSFDPVHIGYDDLEKAEQSSSLGHGSHEMKTPSMYNSYSPSLLHLGGSPGYPGYAPGTPPLAYVPPTRTGTPPLAYVPPTRTGTPPLAYAPPTRTGTPPARYASPPLPPLPMQQLQRQLSYNSAISSTEDSKYSRQVTPGEMKVQVGPLVGPVPDDIRLHYMTD